MATWGLRAWPVVDLRVIQNLVKKVIFIFSIVILVSALIMGILAWQESQTAVILVEWNTASELNTAGFNLFRSESAEGPFEKINPQLVPASPDPLAGGKYIYRDEAVEPGKTYYYELEDIENTGGSTRYGPIEVTSERSGKLQIFLSLILAIVGLIGILSIRDRRTGVSNA